MPSGGHARSGPAPDPRSGASDRKGLKFHTLPSEGYDGDVPEFPGPVPPERILEWWAWAWRTPQAALWATDQWSWVTPAVADWCRLKVQTEGDMVSGSVWTALRQREGDILLSNDALIRAGYIIAADEVAERRDDKADAQDRPASARERAKRLRAVSDG